MCKSLINDKYKAVAKREKFYQKSFKHFSKFFPYNKIKCAFHVFKITETVNIVNQITVLFHPPYSPDLELANYFKT